MGNEFIKTNQVGIVIGIFKNIPVSSTKESGITTTICHNNGFMRRKVGDKGAYSGRVHIDTNSSVSWGTGCCDSHAKEVGSIMSGLVSVQQVGHLSESFLIITGGIGVFEGICVLNRFNGGGIGMMSLANTTILLGDGTGWVQNRGCHWSFSRS